MSILGIEVVLRRGLVYAVLTTVVVGVYITVTVVAGSRLDREPVPGVLAAALVAVALTPLRSRVQLAVDRLVYGSRQDPLQAVTQMGVVVAADHGDLLNAVLASVTAAVRSPGAVVRSADGQEVARDGVPGPGPVFPLRFGGAEIGALEVATRTPGEPYTSGDKRLLAALTPQVAIVSAALELSEALEEERDHVVDATRAERERLRHDLHDGLGPSLSGVRLGLVALQDAVTSEDPTRATALLDRIRAEADLAVGEVRRIIDGLRPSVLDRAGLANALRHHAEGPQIGLHVDVDVPDLPLMPPAVEAAAYRIVQEALTNVTRHAAADHARLTVGVTNEDAHRRGSRRRDRHLSRRRSGGRHRLDAPAGRVARRDPRGLVVRLRDRPLRRTPDASGAFMTTPVRVVLADDHPMFRFGLRAALAAWEDIEVVAEAESGLELVALVERHDPDVVLTDLAMPGLDGATATRRILEIRPDIGVLILTMHEEDEQLFEALRAGARGYLLKDADRDDIARAVLAVATGEAVYGPTVAARIVSFFVGAQDQYAAQVFPELTARELEILELVARGQGNHEIARRLVLSEKTVRNNVATILTKLQVPNRAAMVARARDAGLGHGA